METALQVLGLALIVAGVVYLVRRARKNHGTYAGGGGGGAKRPEKEV